jgi:3-oxoacyl-(acyl-carrier-protein) synthase
MTGGLHAVLGIPAQVLTLSNHCSSGMDALGLAADMVARGELDLAVCGGAEAPLHRFPLLELKAGGWTPASTELPGRMARPFDLWRTTGVVSEGACMFVIEPEDSPRPGYSYIDGYAFVSDEGDELCGGLAEAARFALAEARTKPMQVDVINAWGPGHPAVDAGEARAMIRVFGPALGEIPTVSIKGSIGTPLGAAPAIQIAVAALGHRHQRIPPTVNWEYPDPECPFNLSNQARDVAHERTLVNAHGLGGVNSAMVLRRC